MILRTHHNMLCFLLTQAKYLTVWMCV
jgi:hypothetical protein